MSDQTFLKRLKYLTLADHQATEQTVDLLARLRSPAEYRRLLERFWGFYDPFEQQLAARLDWADYDVAIEQRLKTPALLRDLLALGESPADIAALPRCAELPQADTFAAALGCLYVLEGATLGGQLIAYSRFGCATMVSASPKNITSRSFGSFDGCTAAINSAAARAPV